MTGRNVVESTCNVWFCGCSHISRLPYHNIAVKSWKGKRSATSWKAAFTKFEGAGKTFTVDLFLDRAHPPNTSEHVFYICQQPILIDQTKATMHLAMIILGVSLCTFIITTFDVFPGSIRATAVLLTLYNYGPTILPYVIFGGCYARPYILDPMIRWTIRRLVRNIKGKEGYTARRRKVVGARISTTCVLGWCFAFFGLRRPRDVLPSSWMVAMGEKAREARFTVFGRVVLSYAVVLVGVLCLAAFAWLKDRMRTR
jgi:hypothetical protein